MHGAFFGHGRVEVPPGGVDEDHVQVDGYYKFTQVIKILDETSPELLSCEDVMFDLSGDCEANVKRG